MTANLRHAPHKFQQAYQQERRNQQVKNRSAYRLRIPASSRRLLDIVFATISLFGNLLDVQFEIRVALAFH